MKPEVGESTDRTQPPVPRRRGPGYRVSIIGGVVAVVAGAGLLASRPTATAHGPEGSLSVATKNSKAGQNKPGSQPAKVITVHPPTDVMNRQGLRQFVGISGVTAGAKGLSMNLIVIPPGAAAKPHMHRGFESAIYIIKGRAETRYGDGLKQSVINQAGDFLFIPPDLPHQPRNLSSTEPVLAIVARNDPNEQEHVFPYKPAASPAAKP